MPEEHGQSKAEADCLGWETRLRPSRGPSECDAKRLGENEGNGVQAQVEIEARGEVVDEDEYEYYTDDEEKVENIGPPTIGRPHVPYPIDNNEE